MHGNKKNEVRESGVKRAAETAAQTRAAEPENQAADAPEQKATEQKAPENEAAGGEAGAKAAGGEKKPAAPEVTQAPPKAEEARGEGDDKAPEAAKATKTPEEAKGPQSSDAPGAAVKPAPAADKADKAQAAAPKATAGLGGEAQPEGIPAPSDDAGAALPPLEKIRAAVCRLGWKKWAAIAAVVLVVAGMAIFLAFGTPKAIERSDRDAKENIYMVVKPGTTASEISDRLLELGVIDSRLRFWWLTKIQGDAQKFKTGTYAFSPHMDEQAVLDKLVAGDTTVVKFTIPEGFGIKEIAKRLADEGLVDEQEFLAKAKDFAPYDYMKKRPNERYAAEGYLFPDTYEIHGDASPELILKMMAEDFDTRLTPAMRQQAAEKGLSIHDLITLASLVEKEARYDEDRPIIAQVFLKRLQVGMPLQSDTTLQYLMAGPKENVSLEDTKIDSPYNTYQHAGLPPGPIASPGLKSIQAVLHPAATDYLYFVADHDGHNHYSMTYDEHLAIVEQVR